jgi:peptide deformylase
MNKLKMLESTDPILRKVCDPVLENELELIKDYARNMHQIMLEYNGIGLAAPQVGINKRFFIYGNENIMQLVINPEFTEKSLDEQTIVVEGCLSLPGINVDVERPKKVTMNFKNPQWKDVSMTDDDVSARVWQHEADHLDGLLIDRFIKKEDNGR